MRKLNIKEFVSKANERHLGKYGYDKVNYKNSSTKVTITCPKHGDFEQTPNSHLAGHGCSMCSNNKPKTTKEFVIDATGVHGGYYNYDKVEYDNAKTKVTITCPKHGDFEQTPNSHLSGMGCKTCGFLSIKVKNSIDMNEFINKAVLIHGDYYNYDKVEYDNAKTKVTITCPKHGDFEQIPNSHLRGHGCVKCAANILSDKLSKTTKQFIYESMIVHGERYKYDSVKYEHTNIGVTIICPEHGEFIQPPMKHLQGQGCPICRESKLERFMRKELKKNKIKFIPQYGRSNHQHYLSGQTIDFYLPDYNIGIECQGIQHFEPVDFGNRGYEYANEAFVKLIYNDVKKYNLCLNMGIKLLYYTNCDIKGYFTEIMTDIDILISKIRK